MSFSSYCAMSQISSKLYYSPVFSSGELLKLPFIISFILCAILSALINCGISCFGLKLCLGIDKINRLVRSIRNCCIWSEQPIVAEIDVDPIIFDLACWNWTINSELVAYWFWSISFWLFSSLLLLSFLKICALSKIYIFCMYKSTFRVFFLYMGISTLLYRGLFHFFFLFVSALLVRRIFCCVDQSL